MFFHFIQCRHGFSAGVLALGVCMIASSAFSNASGEPGAEGKSEAEPVAAERRSDSSSEIDLRRAMAVAELAESEYRSAKEKNKKSPGALSEMQLDRLRAKYVIADLNVVRAKLAGSDDDEARREIDFRRAKIIAELAEAEYRSAQEKNEKSPDALSEVELDRLRAKCVIADLDFAEASLAGNDDDETRREIDLRRARAVAELAEKTKASSQDAHPVEVAVGSKSETTGERARKKETPESKDTWWGPATEGVQCRLRAEKQSWQQGRVPKLLADWRNDGTGNWEITLPRENWELEIDGSLHKPNFRDVRDQCVLLDPGGRQQDLVAPIYYHCDLGMKLHALPPGKHTLRLICTLNSTSTDAAEKPLRVVSNPFKVEILPVDDDVAWGEPTDGVQCRLRVDSHSWPQGTAPKLFADLHNQGKRDLSVALESESWELEIDGKWHKPGAFRTGLRRYLPLARGQRQLNVEVWIDPNKKLRHLTPGTHTLRVARILSSALEAPVKERIRVVSNPVEIEIVAAEPQARNETAGGWSDIETVMASLRSEFAEISSAYPELPDADAVRITHTGIFYGLRYIRNCTYLSKRGHKDTGPHPVHLRFEVYSLSEQGDLTRYAVRKLDHTWANLRLVGWTRVYVGEDASPGFADKARRIIDRHVAMVDALDRRAKDTPLPVAKDWGWAVEGVQFRLHTDKSNWPQGTLPELLADFRNRGRRDLLIKLRHEIWRLEIDGKWRQPNSWNTGRAHWLPLGPGQDQKDVKVRVNVDDNLGRKLRELKPGKHTLRVAVYLGQDPPGGPFRVVSNPIEIEILPSPPAAD